MRSSIQETPELALTDLNDAAKLAPQDPKILRTRGAMKLSLKDADGAVADFDAALVLDPEDATTHEAKALTLAMQTKWDEALRLFGPGTGVGSRFDRNPAAARPSEHACRQERSRIGRFQRSPAYRSRQRAGIVVASRSRHPRPFG